MIDEGVASEVTKVLRGVFEKSYATAYGSGPSNGQPVAGKTGTGVDYRDHWLVGYSPALTCAAWIGNRDHSSTSAYLTANSLWHDFMSMALADYEITPFATTSNSYSGTSGSSTAVTPQDTAMKNEIESYPGGSFTENSLTSMYPNYEIRVTYEYSDEYAAGVVTSMTYDPTTHIINAVVSQGPAGGTIANQGAQNNGQGTENVAQ